MGERMRASRFSAKTLTVAKTLVTATGTEINQLAGSGITTADLSQLHAAAAGAASSRAPKIAKVALAAVDTAGGVFAWQNPEAVTVVVDRLQIDATTAATAACTLDCGPTAVSAATLNDTLIDGLDVHTAVILADNLLAPGTDGVAQVKVATGKWITGSTASGASAGLVGSAYIHYHLV